MLAAQRSTPAWVVNPPEVRLTDQPSDRRRHLRVPIALRVRVSARDVTEFAERYATNLSRGGIFLRTASPQPVGTLLHLEVQLADGTPLLKARGEVRYVEEDAPGNVAGMGVQFRELDPASQQLVDRLCGLRPAIPVVGQAAAATAPAERPSLDLPGLRPGYVPAGGGPVIGIDLGTTASRAAGLRHGVPYVLPTREGLGYVPALVALNARGQLVVGQPARGQMLVDPRNTVFGARRLAGRAYASGVVRESRQRLLCTLVEGERGEVAVRLGDATFGLDEVLALVLGEVREVAQIALGQPVSRAVVTVPADADEAQRAAVRRAGELAGLRVERVLAEPIAAALAFRQAGAQARHVLVYDLGGGSFDAAVLALRDGAVELLASGGDTFLGGVDLDGTLVDHLLDCFEERLGHALDADLVALQRIFEAAERARCALSTQESVRLHVPFVTAVDGTPRDLDLTLTRDQLDVLCGPLVDRTMAICADVVARAGRTIDEVLLVGGVGHMPLVRRRLQERFGRAPHDGVAPEEAVALGAALLGEALEGVELIEATSGSPAPPPAESTISRVLRRWSRP